MIGVFLLAWVVFPALMLLLSGGAGMAVRRATGPAAVPALLVVPVGFALLVVVCGLLCYYAALAPLAGPACVLVGVVGLILGRAPLRRVFERRGRGTDLWAVGAAIGAWAIVAAPVVLTGKPGFTGYGHIVDISYQFDLAAHFAHSGRSVPTVSNSAYQSDLIKYLSSGYPGGGQWTLGALSNLMPVDLSWLYQPFLAFVSAMSALSLYSLLGGFVKPRGWRALGAFVAAQPNILMAYGLTGGIKELSTSCFLLLSAALFARVLPRLTPGRSVLAVPIALSATVASLSLTTLPWVGVLSVGVCLTVLVVERDRLLTLLASVQMGVLVFVLSLPTLAASLKLLPVAKSGFGPAELGNLTAPIPGIAAAGVWITRDFRFPEFADRGPSDALAVLVLILAAIGFIYAVRRRAWSVAWLGIAGAVALYYIAHRYGPWIQLKADCVSSPISLLLAFAGIGALMRISRRVVAGALPAVVVAAGVLAGNALLYVETSLAPYERLHDLEYIGERFAGQGPTLTPDFEEDAEYYLRNDDQDSMVNGPVLELRPGVNRAAEPGSIYSYDLNEFVPSWVESFRTIVIRRNPLASRPPSNYRLAYLSRYYEVWQRVQPASTEYAFVPFADTAGVPNSAAACASVTASARRAGATVRIAYMPSPTNYYQLGVSNMKLSRAFEPTGGVITATGAGHATRGQPIPKAGRYDFFLSGSFGRPVNVSVDGHHVGTAAYQESYPAEWLLVGSDQLSAGVHQVEITRGGLSLHPGSGDGQDGFNRTIGPLIISPAEPPVPVVRYSSVRQFQAICRSSQSLRWAEVVRPA